MTRPYKVRERKIKREGADGLIYFKDRLIEIDPRLPPRRWLSTLIHESIHAAYPDLSEEEVLRGEKVMARILWDARVRRTHQ